VCGEPAALQPQEQQHPRDFIKDPFVFEFLNLPQPVSATEMEIESALEAEVEFAAEGGLIWRGGTWGENKKPARRRVF